MKKLFYVLRCIFLPLFMIILLLVGSVGTWACMAFFPTVMDGFFNNYDSSASVIDTVISTEQDWQALALNIEEEGIVLLRNENSALPLSSGTKINLLGYRAYNPVYGGTGSGMTNAENAVTIKMGLEAAGFELNPAIDAIYEEDNEGAASLGFSTSNYAINEIGSDAFAGDASWDNLKAFSETAVIVLGRVGGEANDLYDYVGPNGEHYLELSVEERDLIEHAASTFETLILVYDSANPMELGFLEDYNFDAALLVGDPGAYGFTALGEILAGMVNPSGRLTDTYAYDVLSSPAMQNYGNNTYTNVSAFDSADSDGNAHYVDYVEGIYVGYKWYETADAEGYFAKIGTSYEEVVQYPFGYGLSYTTFTQRMLDESKAVLSMTASDTITVKVEVTNTGNVAGKDVVELYSTLPYTEYDRVHGVEKSEVNLVDYAKTKELAPGESEIVTLEFAVEDLASYDSSCDNGNGTYGSYMLDAGSYVFSIRSDSHSVYDSFSVEMAADYFFNGAQKRSDDIVTATNVFDDAARGIYLSRNNGFANYDEAMASVTDVADETTKYILEHDAEYDEALDDVPEVVEGVDYRASGAKVDTASADYKILDDMEGLSYDDPAWRNLLSQLSLEQMQELICYGGWRIQGFDEIESKTINVFDGPSGLTSMFSTGGGGTAYPATIVLASTWNKELQETYGSYYADEYHVKGVSGCYAPSMNIHRTPFSGRNFEYYSEDATLSAFVGSIVSRASTDKGLIVYAKHYALNDQETNRGNNLCTWASEQAIREIYLKPFEATVKYGHVTGMMSSFNLIGSTWAGQHYGLLTTVLRGEWGFNGVVSTDAVDKDYMCGMDNVSIALRAGNDIWLTFMGSDKKPSIETNADKYYTIRATKNILYAAANGERIGINVKPWRVWLIILDVVLLTLFLLCLYGFIKGIKKHRAEKRGK